jgi:NAD+ kinase
MNIFYEVSKSLEARQEYKRLKSIFPETDPEKAEVIVVIGGDGFMLRILHKYYGKEKYIYGLNFGTVGFLMNDKTDDLLADIKKANKHKLIPLQAKAMLQNGKEKTLLGFNEISIHRQKAQAIQIDIKVNNKKRVEDLICDGALLSTPAGSTAYNFSAGGAILPLDSKTLALTPISSFRPRKWDGAIIPDKTNISFTVSNCEKRPAYITADNKSVENVTKVDISLAEQGIYILTDSNHDLEERIISEQFN